jgi:hypothetical protein
LGAREIPPRGTGTRASAKLPGLFPIRRKAVETQIVYVPPPNLSKEIQLDKDMRILPNRDVEPAYTGSSSFLRKIVQATSLVARIR